MLYGGCKGLIWVTRKTKELAANDDIVLFVPVGEQTKPPDTHKAVRQAVGQTSLQIDIWGFCQYWQIPQMHPFCLIDLRSWREGAGDQRSDVGRARIDD